MARRFKKRPPNWCNDCNQKPTAKCAEKSHKLIRKQGNYVIGRNFEYRIMNVLRKKGCYCMRAYGSHGAFDILAIVPKTMQDQRPMLIQAKRKDYMPAEEEAHMMMVGQSLAGRVMVVTRDEKNKLVFKEYGL